MRILPNTRWGWARAIAIFAAAAAVAFWFWVLPLLRLSQYTPQEGDIVFQSLPHGDLVDAIEGISRSPYSHCGVVVRVGGRWWVIEAIGTVQRAPLFSWVQRGRSSAFAAYRLREAHRAKIPAFIVELHRFLGRLYDCRYEMDDDKIYCSELVYKAWKNATGEEMGKLVKLGEMNWKPYEATIRKYEGGEPPLEREIITPKALTEAPQVYKVYSGGR